MNKQGFTIVELLIVIVVIAILASISVAAYNGVQQRANNDKTQQALASWVKALNMYKVDNGKWPSGYSCLGENYTYGVDGSGSSGYQCRQTASAAGANEQTAFQNMMRPYFNSGPLPTPALTTARNADTYWWRGLTYVYGGGAGNLVYIEATYAGDVNPCPAPGGITSGSRSVFGGNTYCYYPIGLITDS